MTLVLVAGSSGGLGLGAARERAVQGHQVVVHARTRARVPEAPAGHPWHGVVFGDLADEAQTIDVAAQAAAHGRFDAVIHNAGVLRGPELVLAYEELALTAEPGNVMLIYTAEPDSASAERLRLLASWSAQHPSDTAGTDQAAPLSENSEGAR